LAAPAAGAGAAPCSAYDQKMRSAHRRSLTVVASAAALLATVAALRQLRAAPAPPAALEVRFAAIELPPGDPARGRLGSLQFRSGLVLASDDPRFGGLSDLRVSADGQRMVAISDCGYGFSAGLVHEVDGALVGIANARLVDLTGPGGRPLTIGENDAESLVADGPFLDVGFEGKGRVWRYSAEPPFSPPVEVVPTPTGLAFCGTNTGIETMTLVDAGHFLLVCEGERRPSRSVPAWVGRPGEWIPRRYPLHFDGGWTGDPFRPTGATRLENGDVLVVERRFPPFGSRVVRLPRASLDGDGPLAPIEVANLEGSALVANYEGIDARRDEAGHTLVYLVSDDNACAKPGASRVALARTRLLVFELMG
jgi:hypothetical protein